MQTINQDAVLRKIAVGLGVPCQITSPIRSEVSLTLPAAALRDAVQLLLKTTPVQHLTTITIQKDPESDGGLIAQYHFWQGVGISFLLKLSQDNPQLPSIIDLIPGADFYEREAAEMFGIHFTHRDSTPPLLLPDDWEGKPPMTIEEKP
jgi:NADH:ubiquinone oxidoreductase subunit C